MDNVSIMDSDVDSDVNSMTDDEPETKDLHFVELAHSVQVLTGLNSLRLARTLCDVTLCVNDQEFTCHKNVLASFSPYFRAMFTGDLAESQQDRVSLKGVDASAVRQLVDYAYTSEIDITEANVHSLLSAANLFDILPVRDACCKFLEKIMDVTNCLGIHCFAEAHACYDLQKKAKACILWNFSEVATQEEFLQITSTKLTELLSDDLLEVDSEEDVFEAVMQWYAHDPDTRGANFEKVLEQVRLPLMSPNYLCGRVKTAPVVQQTTACRQLLEKAMTYHLPDRCAELGSAHTRSRKPAGKKEVIVIIENQDLGTRQRVDGFSPRTCQWLSITDHPCARRLHSSVTVGFNELYVAGGIDEGGAKRNNVFKYDPTLDSWLEMAPMIVSRSYFGLAELGGYIYAVGGWDGLIILNSVERYDVNNNSWQMVAPMEVAVTDLEVVSVGGQLYVMSTDDVHKTVQKFDPRTETWLVVAPMLNDRYGPAACVLNGHIFVIGGSHAGKNTTNKVESYDPNKDEWRARESMKEQRHLPGVAVADGRIYVFGGEYSEGRYRDTIECYDPDMDLWEVVGKMPSGRSGLSCGVLHIPKETWMRGLTLMQARRSHRSCARHH